MANIYINSQLKLSRNHLQVKDVTDKWTTLHYQQGGLDGACVVYSTIMALLCIGYIPETDINIWNLKKPDKRTAAGKLLSHLLEEQGLVRDGYCISTMAKELRIYCNDLDIKVHSRNSDIAKITKDYVESDIPVVLRVRNEDFDHGILAIGTEYDENEKLHKIFCLDPGYPINGSCYWNCVIDTSRVNTGNFSYWYITDEVQSKIEIKDILAIDWNN